MSWPGAQHKMVVLFNPQRKELWEPLKGTPSTHIKAELHGRGLPHSVINRAFSP